MGQWTGIVTGWPLPDTSLRGLKRADPQEAVSPPVVRRGNGKKGKD